jgi:type VI secretion system Hcp family effector
MAFNAYLVFSEDTKIKGESTSDVAKKKGAIEVTAYGFGVSMNVTTGRSDGGGATVGRANFDPFTCEKGIDTATVRLAEFCCKGTAIKKICLHLYRQGDVNTASGVVKYAMVVFKHCVITKVTISGGGDELPKESMEFNYGVCEYHYQYTDHETGSPDVKKDLPEDVKPISRVAWSTIENKIVTPQDDFNQFEAKD